MSIINKLPVEKVDIRYCQVCALLETQKAIESMAYDIACVGCHKTSYSDFLILGNGMGRKKLLNKISVSPKEVAPHV